MRDRLIELLNEATFGVNKHTLADHLKKETIERVADHLLANGVIVPPVKVWQTVYSCLRHAYKVRKITVDDEDKHIWIILSSGLNGQLIVNETDFGKTVSSPVKMRREL